jgi:hypothetical protein
MKAMGVIGGQEGPNDLEPHLLIDLGVPTLEPFQVAACFQGSTHSHFKHCKLSFLLEEPHFGLNLWFGT